MNEKYELYYLPFNKKKSYTISMALKDKNSFQHGPAKENVSFKPLKELLIKQDTAYKYSKKINEFVKANIYLHRDILEIEKNKSEKGSIVIPLSSISDIKEIYDKSYKQGYSTMMISSVYSSKTKNYYLAFSNNYFDEWFSVLNNHLHQFLDTFSFMKICNDLNELNKKKTSLVIQLINKFSNIKGVLSVNYSKNIFYDFYDNKNIKDIYDLIKQYQENIKNNNYKDAENNLNKIISIFEEKKNLKKDLDEKNKIFENLIKIYEILKKKNENADNIIEIKNENEKEIKSDDNDIKKNDGFFYNLIDIIIKKYFEPRFNEIMNSKIKNDFLNKISDFILKELNNVDNQFYDINASVDELIIVNQ